MKPDSTPPSAGTDTSQSTHRSVADNAGAWPAASTTQSCGGDPCVAFDTSRADDGMTAPGPPPPMDGRSQAQPEDIIEPSSQGSAETKGTTKLVDLHGCHASLPPSLEIRESNNRGRGIYTKTAQVAGMSTYSVATALLTNILSGSIIFSITPHVSVLSTGNLSHFCSACSGPAPTAGLRRCPKCKIVHYCNSVSVQNISWAGLEL